MKIKVNKHNIEINKEEFINEKEVNVSKCYFEFSEEYTDLMVKKALFTKEDKTYEMLIDNNECNYPSEILESDGVCILGVYAYTTDEEFIRFNPTPQKFAIEVGSLRPSENSQPITPSEMEQYQQTLQNGLNEVNKELEEVVQIGNEVAKQGEYATEQGNYAKSVGEQLEKDKENGLFKGEKGDKGDRGEQGIQGEKGEQGEPGKDGENGKDGYTPIKGKDYFDGEDGKDYVLTEADKEEIADNINEENNNRITENEKDIVDLETYLDTITPKASAKGELVHITDALPLPTFETTADGNVEQETTTGKNLFDKNNYIVDSWDNSKNGWLLNIAPGTYTLSANVKLCMVKGAAHLGNAWSDVKFGTDNLNSNSYTFTIEENFNQYLWMTYFDADNNKVVINKDNVSDFNIQLELGDKATPYEPFTNGASPNPDFQQPIEVLEAYNLCPTDINDWEVGSVSQSTGENMEVTNRLRTKDYHPIINNIDYLLIIQSFNYTWLNVIVYDKNKNYVGAYSNIESIQKRELTINIPSSKFPNIAYARFIIRNSSDTTINSDEITTIKPMITKATKQRQYLPYGHIGYKVNGENILNFNVEQILNVTNNSDGTITLNGKGNNNLWYSPIKFKANKKYYIKVELVSGEITGVDNSGIMNPSSTKFLQLNTFDEFSFTKDTNKQTMWTHAQAVYNNARLKIWISDKQTDFEPYKEQIVPLDLKGNWVGAINDDIKDYLVTDKKKYWLVKGITKYVFTGNEPFTNEYGESLFTIANFFDNKPFLVGYGLSNYYIYNPIQSGVDANTKNGDFVLQISRLGTAYSIHFKNTNYNNVENFKADLKEKYNNGTPVEVYYPTKETEIIELGTLEEPIKTFEGTNNIQLLANLDTEIEVKYALDVKKYYDNKLAEISAQII